jgi:hypothetical protein
MAADAQRWYHLLSAVGARDAQAMIDHGGEILRKSTPLSLARNTSYAAGATILGHLALNETERARDVWPELRERLPNLRLCGYMNEDVSVVKRFPITESTAVQFGTDFFNIFNRHYWDSLSFRSSLGMPQTFGTYVAASAPRTIQFHLKILF